MHFRRLHAGPLRRSARYRSSRFSAYVRYGDTPADRDQNRGGPRDPAERGAARPGRAELGKPWLAGRGVGGRRFRTNLALAAGRNSRTGEKVFDTEIRRTKNRLA